nr:hypothetical protein [Clostridia bacterium]
MIPQVLAFIITYRCNFLCDHCSVSVGPGRREVIAKDVMRLAIEQAYILPSIRVISFTGGNRLFIRTCYKTGLSWLMRKALLLVWLLTPGGLKPQRVHTAFYKTFGW